MSIKEKLTSRRFWLSVAAFVAGIAGVIAGLSIENETLTIIGAVCTAVATCIYNICEAVVDKAEADEFVITGTLDSEEDEDEKEDDESDDAEEEVE